MIVLTAEERQRFILYLRQEAASNEALATQANTMDSLQMVVKRYRQKAFACMIVATDLESVEVQTISAAE